MAVAQRQPQQKAERIAERPESFGFYEAVEAYTLLVLGRDPTGKRMNLEETTQYIITPLLLNNVETTAQQVISGVSPERATPQYRRKTERYRRLLLALKNFAANTRSLLLAFESAYSSTLLSKGRTTDMEERGGALFALYQEVQALGRRIMGELENLVKEYNNVSDNKISRQEMRKIAHSLLARALSKYTERELADVLAYVVVYQPTKSQLSKYVSSNENISERDKDALIRALRLSRGANLNAPSIVAIINVSLRLNLSKRNIMARNAFYDVLLSGDIYNIQVGGSILLNFEKMSWPTQVEFIRQLFAIAGEDYDKFMENVLKVEKNKRQEYIREQLKRIIRKLADTPGQEGKSLLGEVAELLPFFANFPPQHQQDAVGHLLGPLMTKYGNNRVREQALAVVLANVNNFVGLNADHFARRYIRNVSGKILTSEYSVLDYKGNFVEEKGQYLIKIVSPSDRPNTLSIILPQLNLVINIPKTAYQQAGLQGLLSPENIQNATVRSFDDLIRQVRGRMLYAYVTGAQVLNWLQTLHPDYSQLIPEDMPKRGPISFEKITHEVGTKGKVSRKAGETTADVTSTYKYLRETSTGRHEVGAGVQVTTGAGKPRLGAEASGRGEQATESAILAYEAEGHWRREDRGLEGTLERIVPNDVHTLLYFDAYRSEEEGWGLRAHLLHRSADGSFRRVATLLLDEKQAEEYLRFFNGYLEDRGLIDRFKSLRASYQSRRGKILDIKDLDGMIVGVSNPNLLRVAVAGSLQAENGLAGLAGIEGGEGMSGFLGGGLVEGNEAVFLGALYSTEGTEQPVYAAETSETTSVTRTSRVQRKGIHLFGVYDTKLRFEGFFEINERISREIKTSLEGKSQSVEETSSTTGERINFQAIVEATNVDFLGAAADYLGFDVFKRTTFESRWAEDAAENSDLVEVLESRGFNFAAYSGESQLWRMQAIALGFIFARNPTDERAHDLIRATVSSTRALGSQFTVSYSQSRIEEGGRELRTYDGMTYIMFDEGRDVLGSIGYGTAQDGNGETTATVVTVAGLAGFHRSSIEAFYSHLEGNRVEDENGNSYTIRRISGAVEYKLVNGQFTAGSNVEIIWQGSDGKTKRIVGWLGQAIRDDGGTEWVWLVSGGMERRVQDNFRPIVETGSVVLRALQATTSSLGPTYYNVQGAFGMRTPSRVVVLREGEDQTVFGVVTEDTAYVVGGAVSWGHMKGPYGRERAARVDFNLTYRRITYEWSKAGEVKIDQESMTPSLAISGGVVTENPFADSNRIWKKFLEIVLGIEFKRREITSLSIKEQSAKADIRFERDFIKNQWELIFELEYGRSEINIIPGGGE